MLAFNSGTKDRWVEYTVALYSIDWDCQCPLISWQFNFMLTLNDQKYSDEKLNSSRLKGGDNPQNVSSLFK